MAKKNQNKPSLNKKSDPEKKKVKPTIKKSNSKKPPIKKEGKERFDKYEKKLKINGSFMDVMKAIAMDGEVIKYKNKDDDGNEPS